MSIPLPPFVPNSTFNPLTPSVSDGPQCLDASHYRTVVNIVLSCLTTAFACSWVSYHANLLQSNATGLQAGPFIKRFIGMMRALILPGLTVGFAMGELVEARKYMNEWNANFKSQCSPDLVTISGKTSQQYERELKDKGYDGSWTLAHGFLAQMGGIWLYDHAGNSKKFVPKAEFSEDPRMRPIIQQIGLISSKDIEDKNKGDWVTKVFVVIQTAWFIAQSVARLTNHLRVTPLEATTLAYAVQNILIYFIWWGKPQSLSEPYRFYLEEDEHLPEEWMTKSDGDEPNANSDTCYASGRSYQKLMSKNKKSLWERLQSGLATEFSFWKQHSIIGLFARCFCAIITGAIHLIPLRFSAFPSSVEREWWLICTFLILILPFADLAIKLGFVVIPFSRSFFPIFIMNTVLFVSIGLTLEAVHIVFLFLSFTTLRSLPAEALQVVQWTRYIPHF